MTGAFHSPFLKSRSSTAPLSPVPVPPMTPPVKSKFLSDKLKREALIERTIGALLKKHPKVARFYQLSHEQGVLRVGRDDQRFEAAVELCGDYVLKTDHSLTGPGLWKLYMTLLRAEEGFSALKGAPGLRPNFHQLEGRWKDMSSSASWPITSCVGSDISSPKAATRATGKPCVGSCAPTAW